MEIKEEIEIPEKGLYDLIFDKHGQFKELGNRKKCDCRICEDNRANKAYFEKYGSHSPFLTTVGKCEKN